MKVHRCTLAAEPRGNAYLEFLAAAERFCVSGALIIHPGKPYHANAMDVIAALGDDLVSTRTVAEWPGTRLADGFDATRHDFRLTPHVLHLLRDRARGLFDWNMPDLPDDLSFWRADGTVWAGSTAHEKDAFIDISSEELDIVRAEFPEFASLIGGGC